MPEPEILLLDEPTRSLDPDITKTFRGLIKECGKTVLVASHNLDEVSEISNRTVSLNNGHIEKIDV